MLAKKTKYALQSSLHLARRYGGGPVPVSELAAQERIPRKFLETILLELKNRGILLSHKGKSGGFVLGRPPDQISIGEIIRLMEGPLALLLCVSATAYQPCPDCGDERTCGIRMLFKELRDSTAQLMDGTTLADLIARVDSARGDGESELMYHI